MARRCAWFPACAGVAWILGMAPVPAWSQSASVAPGDVIRIRAPKPRVVVPDLVTLQGGRLETRRPHESRDDVVLLHDGDRTLHVPRPGKELTGRLVGITDELLTLRDGGDRTISVPRQAIERVEVRRGGEHRAAGMAIGATAAFALGYLVGYSAEKNCGGWCFPEAAGALLGVLLAVPGAAAGRTVAGGRWEPVSMENLRVGLALRKDGASAGVTFSF